MQTPIVLVYGHELALLSLRRLVLASGGYDVLEASNFCEVKSNLLVRPVDLLVLCHSLSNADCEEISQELAARPGPKTLVLTAGPFSGCAAIPGKALNVMEGPTKLLSTVSLLLNGRYLALESRISAPMSR